jgi:hypothetical protein
MKLDIVVKTQEIPTKLKPSFRHVELSFGRYGPNVIQYRGIKLAWPAARCPYGGMVTSRARLDMRVRKCVLNWCEQDKQYPEL